MKELTARCLSLQESEAIAQSPSPQQALRNFLLAKIAGGSPQGARLAARFAETDGPIEVAAEDVPPEFWEIPEFREILMRGKQS